MWLQNAFPLFYKPGAIASSQWPSPKLRTPSYLMGRCRTFAQALEDACPAQARVSSCCAGPAQSSGQRLWGYSLEWPQAWQVPWLTPAQRAPGCVASLVLSPPWPCAEASAGLCSGCSTTPGESHFPGMSLRMYPPCSSP